MSWRVHIKSTRGHCHLDVELHGADEPIALIGPNGSGKTTLLRGIAGAYPLERGHIEVDGTLLFNSVEGVNIPSQARGLGYVPQGYGLFPHLSVLENVAFGLSTGQRRRSRRERTALARTALEELECVHLVDRTPEALSGGERQRVALARALVVQPNLLLLDEPLAALDATARRTVRRFLSDRLRSLKLPSIVVTHDVRDVQALGAEVCVLEEGRIIQRGSLTALRASPATDFVAEFLGLEN